MLLFTLVKLLKWFLFKWKIILPHPKKKKNATVISSFCWMLVFQPCDFLSRCLRLKMCRKRLLQSDFCKTFYILLFYLFDSREYQMSIIGPLKKIWRISILILTLQMKGRVLLILTFTGHHVCGQCVHFSITLCRYLVALSSYCF